MTDINCLIAGCPISIFARQTMLWPIRQVTAPNVRRIGASAPFSGTAQLPFVRGLQIYPVCSMSATTSRSTEAHRRENEIYQSVVSRIRKEVQETEERARTTHERRTAADPRQNTIHDVRLTSILELYDRVRLLRLQVMNPSATDPEQEHEHPSSIDASNTSIVN